MAQLKIHYGPLVKNPWDRRTVAFLDPDTEKWLIMDAPAFRATKHQRFLIINVLSVSGRNATSAEAEGRATRTTTT